MNTFEMSKKSKMQGMEIIKTEKVRIIQPEIENFKSNISKIFKTEEVTKILEALNKMIDLHFDQEDRPDGRPYISHPLEIASDLLEKYGVEDYELIIGALMHDSIEDQKTKLFSSRMKRKFPESWNKGTELQASKDLGDSHQKELSEIALMEIGDMYGRRVMRLVAHLSNPDLNSMTDELGIGSIEKANDLYKEHVAEAIKDPDVFVIKYADFARNALLIGNLPEGDKKDRLIKKYGPVIQEVFLPAFKTMSKSHPMYIKREEIIETMSEEYKKHYLSK